MRSGNLPVTFFYIFLHNFGKISLTLPASTAYICTMFRDPQTATYFLSPHYERMSPAQFWSIALNHDLEHDEFTVCDCSWSNSLKEKRRRLMDQPDTPGNVPPVPNKESDNRSPVVSLIYQTAKSPGTPGVPSGFKVDIETYNTAYTKKWQDVTSFEKVTREQHPDWTNEQVIQARNDHQLDRMHTLEALMAVHKLEWVMEWRVQEELLQIGTEAERTRVKKLDREHRVVRTEGPPSARKARTAKEVVHIPKNPEEKKEAAISVLMNRLGFTREEAEARFTMMEAIKTNVAPTE